MATEGTGANAARDLGQTWKISPCVRIKPKQTFTVADIQGEGAIQQIWMTPTGQLALYDPTYLLGRRSRRRRSKRRSATSSPAAGVSTAQISLARDLRESGQRIQLLLGDAVPEACTHHGRKYRRRRDDALLPGELHAHGRSEGRRVLSCPVPPRESAAVQVGLHHPRRRARVGTVRRAPTWRGE